MAVVPLPELEQVADGAFPSRYDVYARHALARSYEEYLARRRAPLAPFRIRVGGRECVSFYDLLVQPPGREETVEVRLDPAPAPVAAWEFLRPFERIRFDGSGGGTVEPPGGGEPTRVILRFLLREHYLARTRSEEDRAAGGAPRVALPTLLRSFPEGIEGCRRTGLLPFSVAVLAYFPDERIVYDFDLLRSLALADPRAGRFPLGRWVHRSARVAWQVDRVAGRGEMPLLSARCLTFLAESGGLTAVEMSHIFGGLRELVASALQGLAARGFVSFDRRTGVYRVRMETFFPAAESPSASAEPVGAGAANPALRTSVQELIAAADARATCPLCGRPRRSDSPSILCDQCSATVGVERGAGLSGVSAATGETGRRL